MHILINTGEEYDKKQYVIKDKLDEFRHPDNRWLRVACSQLGGGWRCHIKRVWDDQKRSSNIGLVVGYILKYMGKDMASFEFPKHQRRIQTSRKVGSPASAAKGVGTWQHKREIGLDYLKTAEKRIVDMTTGEIINERSFEGEAYYPPYEYYKGEDSLTNETKYHMVT